MNFKNCKAKFSLLIIFLLGINHLTAQKTAITNVTATIVTSSTIKKIKDLNFGSIISSNIDGTIVLGTDGAGTFTNVITASTPDNVNPAMFEIIGEPGGSYTLTTPTTIILTNANGSTMKVSTFTTKPVLAVRTMGTLPSSGKKRIYLGATLHVSSNQESGVYSNTTDLTVDINFK